MVALLDPDLPVSAVLAEGEVLTRGAADLLGRCRPAVMWSVPARRAKAEQVRQRSSIPYLSDSTSSSSPSVGAQDGGIVADAPRKQREALPVVHVLPLVAITPDVGQEPVGIRTTKLTVEPYWTV